jgi:hypothetical protein
MCDIQNWIGCVCTCNMLHQVYMSRMHDIICIYLLSIGRLYTYISCCVLYIYSLYTFYSIFMLSTGVGKKRAARCESICACMPENLYVFVDNKVTVYRRRQNTHPDLDLDMHLYRS